MQDRVSSRRRNQTAANWVAAASALRDCRPLSRATEEVEESSVSYRTFTRKFKSLALLTAFGRGRSRFPEAARTQGLGQPARPSPEPLAKRLRSAVARPALDRFPCVRKEWPIFRFSFWMQSRNYFCDGLVGKAQDR